MIFLIFLDENDKDDSRGATESKSHGIYIIHKLRHKLLNADHSFLLLETLFLNYITEDNTDEDADVDTTGM